MKGFWVREEFWVNIVDQAQDNDKDDYLVTKIEIGILIKHV